MRGNEILTESIERNTFHVAGEGDSFIFTLSDLHIGLGNKEYIQNIINFIKDLPNAYTVIGSDLIDNPTKNSKGSVLECYADTQEQIHLAVELLKPIKDKIVAIVDAGNHEDRTMKESYISITQMIATLLEIPQKYVKDFALGYFDIGKNTYIYGNIHKHRKQIDYYDYMNTDILVLEHTHELSFREKPKLYHNKYTKRTSVRNSYIINNGSMMAFPPYAKKAGYKMQPIGTYVIELFSRDRNIIIWRDSDLYTAIKNGYKSL